MKKYSEVTQITMHSSQKFKAALTCCKFPHRQPHVQDGHISPSMATKTVDMCRRKCVHPRHALAIVETCYLWWPPKQQVPQNQQITATKNFFAIGFLANIIILSKPHQSKPLFYLTKLPGESSSKSTIQLPICVKLYVRTIISVTPGYKAQRFISHTCQQLGEKNLKKKKG